MVHTQPEKRLRIPFSILGPFPSALNEIHEPQYPNGQPSLDLGTTSQFPSYYDNADLR